MSTVCQYTLSSSIVQSPLSVFSSLSLSSTLCDRRGTGQSTASSSPVSHTMLMGTISSGSRGKGSIHSMGSQSNTSSTCSPSFSFSFSFCISPSPSLSFSLGESSISLMSALLSPPISLSESLHLTHSMSSTATSSIASSCSMQISVRSIAESPGPDPMGTSLLLLLLLE